MSTQNIRLFLFAALVLIGMLLFNHWQREQPSRQQAIALQNAAVQESAVDKDIPAIQGTEKVIKEIPNPAMAESKKVTVKTDVFNLTIDTLGGDIVYLNLPAYPEGDKANERYPYVLLDTSKTRYYIAQSGLTGESGPDQRGVGRAQYSVASDNYTLADGQDRLVVDFKTTTKDKVDIVKRFVFYRGNYAIQLEYMIDNQGSKEYKGSLYARLKRRPEPSEGSGFLGIQTYTGAAYRGKTKPYQKISFKDIEEKPLSEEVTGGWAAMVEHYFVGAWVPEAGIPYTYQTTHLSDGSDAIGFVAPPVTVAPGSQDNIEAQLYAGPQITQALEKLAPGLELSVDYGILWPICQPIFWLLKQIYDLIGNWGWSIVIITILIKLVFYRLSASSYRSLGNMRKLQPKIEALKERYSEDKQKFSQAVMELYKKEKVNPLGGCLPVVVQIPVFIALYYVLLGSVELRQAPFILWIHDLSARDPFYVLPILMGISMFVQQKLNPPPPDPVQAKVMMFMPVIFTVLFLNFPAGLVLYWCVNNLLSIAQQWYITRNVGRARHGAT